MNKQYGREEFGMRFERTILALGILALAPLGAPALAAIDPTDAMALCSRLTTKESRLECYDQVARDTASGVLQSSAAPQAASAQAPAQNRAWTPPPPPNGVAASGPSWAAPPMPQAPTPQQERSAGPAAGGFGSEALKRNGGSGEEPKSIQVEVASSSDNGLEQWRIALVDGAIWQMTERVGLFRPPAPREIVTIRKGAMGGYLMDVGKQGSVRVMRIK
jgi:hypothetical protein